MSESNSFEKSTQGKRLLIVGCGDLGIHLAALLHKQGVEVWGLRREPSKLPAFIHRLAADVTSLNSLACLRDLHFDSAVISLTPGEFSDKRYRQIFVEGLANVLQVLNADQLIFVSSSSVYHQSDQQWVDEDSPTAPSSFSGKRLLEAEALLDGYASPSTVVRFAGIYGPGRRRLIEQVINGEGSPAIYSNRIHRDDCVGFLAHLVLKQWAGVTLPACYLAVDSEPVLLSEVKIWLAGELGIDPTTLQAQSATRRGSKRCSNRRMLASGYQLRYPSFREGYQTVLNEQDHR